MSKFQTYKQKNQTSSYLSQSESNNDLNWIGDLLDPWKGSKQSFKNQTTISSKNVHTYGNKNPEHKFITQIKQLLDTQLHINSQDEANSFTYTSKKVIVVDQEESFEEIKPLDFLPHSQKDKNQKRQLLKEPGVQYALHLFEDEQQDESVSFSMLFKHPFTNSQAKNNTLNDRENSMRDEKIQQKQVSLSCAQNNNWNKVKFNYQIESNQIQRQVIEYFPSLKKKTHKRHKSFNKKIKIPPSQMDQLEECLIKASKRKYENLIKEQKRLLRQRNRMKIQAKKDIYLIECEQVQISFQEEDGINDANSIQFEVNEFEQIQKQNFERSHQKGQEQVNNEHFQTRNESINNTNNNSGISRRQQKLNLRQQQTANEFDKIIRIVGVRYCGIIKQYKWEIGTQSFWKSIGQALSQNFQIYIRKSKKYRAKFFKYIPKNIIQKRQSYNKFECMLEDKSVSKIKHEKIREFKIRSKNRYMYDLKDIFDKVLLSKIIQYEKLIEEKGRQNALEEFEDGMFSEFEPNSNNLQDIIEDIVINTNNSFRKRRSDHKQISQKPKQLKATNQLLIQNLNKATETYNYIDCMKQLFSLNVKHPTLSCLNQEGLGLRSNNLKIIDKATFQQEMNRIRLMKEAIQLNDSDSNPVFRSNEKFESEKRHFSLKLQ